LYNVLYTVSTQQYISTVIYCCVLTVYNTLHKFVNTQWDGLCQISEFAHKMFLTHLLSLSTTACYHNISRTLKSLTGQSANIPPVIPTAFQITTHC